jgi:hypothetical protein
LASSTRQGAVGAVSGVNLFTFTADRAAITEVLVYRTPLAEDRAEFKEGHGGGGSAVAPSAGSAGDRDGLHDLRLNRLHDEPKGRKA